MEAVGSSIQEEYRRLSSTLNKEIRRGKHELVLADKTKKNPK